MKDLEGLGIGYKKKKKENLHLLSLTCEISGVQTAKVMVIEVINF